MYLLLFMDLFLQMDFRPNDGGHRVAANDFDFQKPRSPRLCVPALLSDVWGFGSVASRTILDVAFVNHIVAFSLTGGQWAVAQDTHEVLVHVSGSKKIRADVEKIERVFDRCCVTVAKALASSSDATNKCE